MVRENKIFLVFAVVLLTFSGAYIYLSNSPRFNITEIRVQGNHRITEDEILGQTRYCLGRNIFSLDLKRIQRELKEDIRIKKVRVKRKFPGCISIEIEEKSPVLWISVPAGSFDLGDYGIAGLSIDQELIPLDLNDLSCDLPLVSGIEIERAKGKPGESLQPYRRWDNFKVKKALEFYKMLLRIDPSAIELLAEINLKDMTNMILYLLPHGTKVMMGWGDYERKWRRVRTILAEGKKLKEPVCLDLRFDDQVVTSSFKGLSSGDIDHRNRSSNRLGENL